jgi:hypothetical protein
VHEVQLGFDPAGYRREYVEKRLQRLHAECGCHAGAIAFLLALVAGSVGARFYQIGSPFVLLGFSVGVAVITKIAAVVVARITICDISRHLEQ